jgi:hypothetical protein
MVLGSGEGYERIFLAYALLDMVLRGLGMVHFSPCILFMALRICYIVIPSAYIALLLPTRL